MSFRRGNGEFMWLKIDKRIVAALALLLLIASLIPVYRIGLYSEPFYDDYVYSLDVKNAYEAEGVQGIAPAVFETVSRVWKTWQGTYSSVALMSLTSLVFGEEYYFIGVWVCLTVMTVGGFILPFTGFRKILKADIASSLIAGALSSFMFIEFVYYAFEGLLWYNSAVHYTFMHGMMFILLAVQINLIYANSKASRIGFYLLEIILAIIVAGSNFVTSLQGLLFFLIVMVLAFVKSRREGLYHVPAFLAYLVGFLQNVLAPGNSVRASFFNGFSAVKAMGYSVSEAVVRLPELTKFTTPIVLLALVPVIVEAVGNVDFSFKLPGVVSVLLFGMYATGYVSSFFGVGGAPVWRTMCAVKYTYQLTLLVCMIYWIGWAVKKRQSKGKTPHKINHNLIYYAICTVLMIMSYAFSGNRVGEYSTMGAYTYTHYYVAQSLDAEYKERIETIKNSEEAEVYVKPYETEASFLIGNNELSENPNEDVNRAMADYYGKDKIMLQTKE